MANYSLSTDGSGVYTAFPFPAITGDWALSWWMKLLNPSGSFIAVIDNTGSRVYTLFLDHTGVCAGFCGTMVPQSGNFGASGAWHHLVITRTSSTLSAYVDGSSILAVFDGATASAMDLYMGSNASGSGSHPQAKYADVRLYSAALSGSDISALYAGTDVTTNLARHWGMTEGSGTTVADSVGGNTATWGGAAWDTDVPTALSGGGGGGTTYTSSLSGTLTASATLARSTGKVLAGSLAAAGSLARRAGKALSGSLSASGSAVARSTGKALAGTLAASGSLSRRAGKALAGTLTSAGSLARQVGKALAGSLSAAGSLTRSTGGTGSLRTGLLAYYKLDESSGDALDAFNTFDLADHGSVGTAAGVLNTSRSFDGSTQYLSMTGNFGFGATTGAPFSVAGWFYPDTVSGFKIALGRADATHLFQVWLNFDKFEVDYGVSPFNTIVDPTSRAAGAWYHVAFTFSSAGLGTFFINGAAVGSDPSPTGSFAATTDLNIGRRGGDGNSPWSGRIDEVGWWSRELTSSEVSALYGGGTPPALATFGGAAAFLRTLSGSLSAAGSLAKIRAVLRSFSGGLTASGSLARSTLKSFAGTLASSAALARSALKSFAGTLTASGSLAKIRAVLKSFSGTLTASGSAVTRQAGKALAGTLAASGTTTRALSRALAGSLAASATLARRTARPLAGSLAASGSTVARTTGKALSGSLAASGTIARRVAKAFIGGLTASGSFLKSIVGSVFTPARHPDPSRSTGRRLGPDPSRSTGSRN